LNIILNAANAMPDGGKLTVSTLVNPEGKAEVRFADTGSGIPREHLDNIFDPFFTAMPTGQGTGLGLSVSYGIIQQHGGSIEVESTVGVGTTFTVKLLLAKDDRATGDVQCAGIKRHRVGDERALHAYRGGGVKSQLSA